jgi:hypothetical protein
MPDVPLRGDTIKPGVLPGFRNTGSQPPGAGTSVARGGLPRSSGRWPRKPFWVGYLLYEISSALENTNILFPLANMNPRCGKFGMLRGCQSRLGALVNGVLCTPFVDSLLAETKIVGDVLYGLTGFGQVERLPAKSSRVRGASLKSERAVIWCLIYFEHEGSRLRCRIESFN